MTLRAARLQAMARATDVATATAIAPAPARDETLADLAGILSNVPTVAAPLPQRHRYALTCGHCQRQIATRDACDLEGRDAAYGHLMGLWRMHAAMSGHPGLLAVLSDQLVPWGAGVSAL